MRRRVIDCTAYTYEPSALAVRLTELAGVVDAHHIVSGDHTYRGKPQQVDAVEDLCAAGYGWVDTTKATFKQVALPGGEPLWLSAGLTTTEKIQRNLTFTEARHLGDQYSLYLISDCDEIPHPDAIEMAVARYDARGPQVLSVDARCWYADWSAAPNGNPWQTRRHHQNQPIIGTARDILTLGGAQMARSNRGYGRNRRWAVQRGKIGWHLSNLDGPHMVADKFAKFSHKENDNETDSDLGFLEMCVKEQVWPIHGWPLHRVDDVPSCVPFQFPNLVGPT
jgi:hypothetical protein